MDPIRQRIALAKVLVDLEREVAHANAKHPQWPTDLLRQVAIIQEEAGELQKAALSLVEEPHQVSLNVDIDREAAQLGAMVLRFMVARAVRTLQCP